METFKAITFAIGYWLSMIVVGQIWKELQYKRYIKSEPDGQGEYA